MSQETDLMWRVIDCHWPQVILGGWCYKVEAGRQIFEAWTIWVEIKLAKLCGRWKP